MLFRSTPAFNLLFPRNGCPNARVTLKVDKAVNAIAVGEAGNSSFPVLCNSARDIVCHACVEVPGAAGQDINIVAHNRNVQIPLPLSGIGMTATGGEYRNHEIDW